MLKKSRGIFHKKVKESEKEIYLYPKNLNTDLVYNIAVFESDEKYYDLRYTLREGGKAINIGYIDVPRGQRQGNATELVKALFEVREIYFDQVKEIYGMIDYEDEEHLKAQKSFYEKMGFKVEGNIFFKKF